ncbi:unnamed protein product [Schistocephalus solidus]|uniref:Neural cell adhesion molecule l1 n=1 Tax=Schistocephalus solidus TaxID=70667 RepID=A0A183SF11_SCHSO|nr:unnamed protein product [Schistocephalus solidus]
MLWQIYVTLPLINIFVVIPVITEDPQDSFALRKKTLSLHCRAEGEPPPLILWYKNGRLVESFRDRPGTSNKVIKAEDLFFLSFDEEDEGVYYCNASNSEGWAKSKEARVSLSFLEPITLGPESQTSSVGDTVILRCVIPKGLPEPIIEWYHNRQLVNYSSRIILNNGSLHIKSLQKTDAGTYQCTVKNRADRRESLTAVLTVYKKPWFELTPTNQQVKVGEDVEFHCIADGDPKPSILWRRDDRGILKDGGNLQILQVRREDEGIYICKAANLVGSIDASAKLSVLSSPNFTLTPKDTTVLEGETAVFHCQATGLPTPFIRWVHNGDYFLVPEHMSAPIAEVSRIHVTHNGSLVIFATRKSDEGKYECRASQKNGIVRSSANLLVNDFNSLPTVVIELGPQNQTYLYGTTATLHCKARVFESLNLANSNIENVPRTAYGVSISWLKDGKSIVPGGDPRVVMISPNTLHINEVNSSDEGNYTCRAEASTTSHSQSSTRFAEWTAYLRVSRQPPQHSFIPENLPHPPETFDVVKVGDSWISVRCEVSADSANDDFDLLGSKDPSLDRRTLSNTNSAVRVRIEYLALDGSHGWLIAAEGEPNELIRITNLQPENGYRMLARIVDSHGISKPFILPHTIYTRKRVRYVDFDYRVLQENVLSVRLSRLRLTSLSTSEVQVSGMFCSLRTSVEQLTGIRFRYKSVHLSRCFPKRFNPFHDYLPVSVESSAFPDNDCVDSDQRTFLPEINAFGPPEYMESIADNYCSLNVPPDQLDAFWELPDDLLNQQNLVNESNYKFMEWNSNLASSFRQVIDGLSPFVCYEIAADAYADHQLLGRVYSSSSRSSTILTFDSKPSEAPQNVRARWTGRNSTVLEVMWRPPLTSSTNGLITGYLLRMLGNTTNFSRTFKVSHRFPYRSKFLLAYRGYFLSNFVNPELFYYLKVFKFE